VGAGVGFWKQNGCGVRSSTPELADGSEVRVLQSGFR
jgi:hypothetical protein